MHVFLYIWAVLRNGFCKFLKDNEIWLIKIPRKTIDSRLLNILTKIF